MTIKKVGCLNSINPHLSLLYKGNVRNRIVKVYLLKKYEIYSKGLFMSVILRFMGCPKRPKKLLIMEEISFVGVIYATFQSLKNLLVHNVGMKPDM